MLAHPRVKFGLFLAFLCPFLLTPAYADTAESPVTVQKEISLQAPELTLTKVRDKIQETSTSLKRDKKILQSHNLRLAKIENQLSEINREMHQQQQKIIAFKTKMSHLTDERQRLTAQLTRQKEQLAAQLRRAYMQGNQGAVKLLLNIQSAEHLSRMMMYYDYLHNVRLQTITQTKQVLAKLETNNQQIELQRKALTETTITLEKRQKLLAHKAQERQEWVDKIQEKLASKSLLLDQLRDDAVNLEKTIAKQQKKHHISSATQTSATAGPMANLMGHLSWPVTGDVQHHFGERIQNKLNWKGIVINSEPGSSVISPMSGQVIFADWMRGFGLLLIVDHGQGYMSLYGRNQVLYKQPGDEVATGEVIGLVGTSGGFAKPGLYFEIRHQGLPVDPEKWLNKAIA